jgi:hypothetical protein
VAIDQRKLERELVFSGQGTAAELTADLDQINALEKSAKRRTSLLRWSVLVVFVIFIALALLSTTWTRLFAICAVVFPVAILFYSLRSKPILMDRVSFARLLLKTLGQDAGKRGRFEVLLRLRANRVQLSTGPHPHKGGVTQKMLKDEWITLNARLNDGTSIRESAVDLIRQRSKRNPRGKLKTKERVICLLRVQLSYKPERYGDATVVASRVHQPFRLPDGATIKASNFTKEMVSIKTIVRGNVASDKLTAASEAMLLGAYRILNLSRRTVKATGGSK